MWFGDIVQNICNWGFEIGCWLEIFTTLDDNMWAYLGFMDFFIPIWEGILKAILFVRNEMIPPP